MNASKQLQLLQSQTSLAQKVFECVPVQEAWDTTQIMGELRRVAGSGASIHALRACLGALEDQGLIRQPKRNTFQRYELKLAAKPKDTDMPTATVTAITKPAAVNHMAVLGELASDVTALAEEFTARLKAISERIEEAALAVEQERETSANSMAKVKQLSALMKDIGELA